VLAVNWAVSALKAIRNAMVTAKRAPSTAIIIRTVSAALRFQQQLHQQRLQSPQLPLPCLPPLLLCLPLPLLGLTQPRLSQPLSMIPTSAVHKHIGMGQMVPTHKVLAHREEDVTIPLVETTLRSEQLYQDTVTHTSAPTMDGSYWASTLIAANFT